MPVPILQGLTVIERATFVIGPYAAALLADLGARVIKTDRRPQAIPIVTSRLCTMKILPRKKLTRRHFRASIAVKFVAR
jgi:crotonobetainyl-CoA:carnitine CoA-transferase CaiB-like acyl-CoA transferase